MSEGMFERLMLTVRAHVPGAVTEAIKQELFLTMQEFFTISGAWREDVLFILMAGKNRADVTPTAGRIEALMFVKDIDGRAIRGAYLEEDCTIVMPYPANVNTKYNANIAVTVSDPVNRDSYPIIPKSLLDRYTDALVHGITARMMLQPMKPYSNPNLSQYHYVKFKSMASRAGNEVKNGYTQGSQVWAFPQSFSTITKRR